MNKPFRVGIIGGGQLGMMLLQEAKLYNPSIHYTILEAQEDCPARPYADAFIQGNLTDAGAIEALAAVSDVLTWEIEHINVDILLTLEAQGKTVIPRPKVLKMIQDKGAQKQFFTAHQIPTAPYQLPEEEKDIDLSQFPGEKIVLKSRKGGYDGKGVAILTKSSLNAYGSPFEGPILIEEFAENVKELAIIVAVDTHGNRGAFPAIDMYFNPKSNLVEFLYSPSLLTGEVLERASQIAQDVVASFDSPGLFAVEMFLTENKELWVNEIAPRPHNSGHHSIEGFETSQFAQLNHILLGEELGPMGLKRSSAMLNLVGPDEFSGSYAIEKQSFWDSQEEVFVHMYGKTETRPNRKLGHVTVVADNMEGLMRKAQWVKENMRIIPS